MNRLALCVLVGASALLAGTAVAQQAPNFDAVQIKATDLGNRTWMLEGQGGNITVVAGDDGVIMVDTQFGPLYGKIKAAVAQVSDQQIKYVINTHQHGDHVGGNTAFKLGGATVVAHANLRDSMAEGTTNALTGNKTPAATKGALPDRVYTGAGTTVAVRGRRVQVMHQPTAHTRGDSAVWIADANVLATGDIVSWGMRYPNIDVGDSGDIDGIIRAVDGFIRRTNANSRIVPGHGALMTKADLVAYRQLLVDARAAVAKAKASGMTEEQVVAAKPLAGDIQTRAGANDMASVNFTRLIYKSI